MKLKLLILAVCLIVLSAFSAVSVNAHPYCGRFFVHGHYNRHGRWIPPHWTHRHWIPGHRNPYGRWIHGHCA